MAYREVLVFVHRGASNDAAVRLATSWAAAHDAAVAGCCLAQDPAPSVADSYATGDDAVLDVLERRQATIAAEVQPLVADLSAAAAVTGVQIECVVPDPSTPLAHLARRARFADLSVIGRSQLADHPARALAEMLAVGGAAPCLIVPTNADAATPKRVVVAWNGSSQAKRAIDDAIPLLQRAKAVQLLVLGDQPEWLEMCGPHEMIRRLSRHGVAATLRTAHPGRGEDGGALADACELFDADLLVMGAYSHSRTREALLGGATRAVLRDFPIPAFLSR